MKHLHPTKGCAGITSLKRPGSDCRDVSALKGNDWTFSTFVEVQG